MIENISASLWTKQDLNAYQIFDVRTPLEWEEGILPNAQCVALYDNQGLLNAKFLDEFQSKREMKVKNLLLFVVVAIEAWLQLNL